MSHFKVVVETGSWFPDGRMEESHDCGHRHRTVKTACKCLRKLTKIDDNHNWSARWHNARIHDQDGKRVEPVDRN